jgi:hypothetical protein
LCRRKGTKRKALNALVPVREDRFGTAEVALLLKDDSIIFGAEPLLEPLAPTAMPDKSKQTNDENDGNGNC